MNLQIQVLTGYYKFLTYSELKSKNIQSIFTEEVRDCVVLKIETSKGVVFAHFFRTGDHKDLLKKLLRDIDDEDVLKVTLYGGHLINGYFPWNIEKRTVFSHGLQDKKRFEQELNASELSGFKASEECINLLDFDSDILNLKNFTKHGLDFESWHKKLKSLNFSCMLAELIGNPVNKFEVKNGKDMTAYQNFANICFVLLCLLTIKQTPITDISYVYTPINGEVRVEFKSETLKKATQIQILEEGEEIEDLIEFRPTVSIRKSMNLFLLLNHALMDPTLRQDKEYLIALITQIFEVALKKAILNNKVCLVKDLIKYLQAEKKHYLMNEKELSKLFKDSVSFPNDAEKTTLFNLIKNSEVLKIIYAILPFNIESKFTPFKKETDLKGTNDGESKRARTFSLDREDIVIKKVKKEKKGEFTPYQRHLNFFNFPDCNQDPESIKEDPLKEQIEFK